jgi:hypothetical protein
MQYDKEILKVLKDMDEKLGDISFDLKDIKVNIPKVPYYGDLLEDIKKAIEDSKRR